MIEIIKKFKYLFMAGFILACVSAWYAYSEYMRKPAAASELGADFTLTAEALQKAFETNEAAALKKYLDKVIEVSGTISVIAGNGKKTDISLETPDPMVAVTVQVLPEDQQKAAMLKAGDKVKLKGICTGIVTDIELNKGAIIQ